MILSAAEERRLIAAIRRATVTIDAARVEIALENLKQACTKANFDPNQPRVPAGSPDGGRWTETDGTGAAGLPAGEGSNRVEISVETILAEAPRLAASRASLNLCIALCSPLLDRAQPRGTTNINYWDFVRCLNACLGK